MSAETKPVSFPVNGHPDENQLFLALEHELSPGEAEEVERHVGNCWSCRARSEEMQRGILAFVEYREKRFLPALPSPPDDYRQFRGRLRAAAQDESAVSLRVRVWRKVQAIFTWRAQVRWVSAVALGMVAVIVWVEVIHPPAVSASELLTRAVAAQNPSVSASIGTPLRTAHQTLRIRSGNRTVVRKFEWTIGSGIPETRWENERSPMDWNSPLTAVSFRDWRNTLQEKNDSVKRSGNLLTLDTTTSQKPIREAWMVVRSGDFHPVEQHLRFFDDTQLDLTEVDFEITDQTPAVTERAPSIEKPRSTPAGPVEIQTTPPAPKLDETELQLRYLLFTHGWDLGEDLNISRVPGRVRLSGTVSSPERERAMRVALSAVENVQLSITAPDAANGLPVPKQQSAGKTRPPAAMPLLSDALEENFTTRVERLAFVERSLDASDQSLSHAWALKNLADRYLEADEHLLEPASRARLREMLRAHLQQIRHVNADLNPLLALLQPADDSGSRPNPSTWRASVLELFAEVQRQDGLVADMLVGTHAEAQDLTSSSAQLQSAHQRIAALLANADSRLNEGW